MPDEPTPDRPKLPPEVLDYFARMGPAMPGQTTPKVDKPNAEDGEKPEGEEPEN